MKVRMTLLLCITGAFFSCKKKQGNISIVGQGDGAQLQMFKCDTFKLLASTVREDSLPGNGLTYNMLGTMSDPLLGKTTSSIYSAVTLYEPNTDFPNTETPDSAVLFVPIIDGLNFYGNRLTPQDLSIRFVATDIDASLVYYQNYTTSLDMSMETLYHGPMFFSKYDSIRYLTGKVELHPGLRVKLSSPMANALMHLPKEAFQTNEGLAKYLKGVAFIPQDKDLAAGEGGIGVFDFYNATSLGYRAKIFLYYRDTQTFTFTFAGSSRTITSGQVGPLPPKVQEQLNNPNANYGETYVQSLQGVKTFIRIPELLDLLKNESNNIAINRAEITFVINKTDNTGNFYAPPRLNLLRPTNLGGTRNYLLPDAVYSTFGGDYNDKDGTYTFLITRYVQDILDSKFFNGTDNNFGLFLAVPTASPVLATRASVDFSNPKTKLKITYSKLN